MILYVPAAFCMTACEARRDVWKCCIGSLSFEFSSADADAGAGSSFGPEGKETRGWATGRAPPTDRKKKQRPGVVQTRFSSRLLAPCVQDCRTWHKGILGNVSIVVLHVQGAPQSHSVYMYQHPDLFGLPDDSLVVMSDFFFFFSRRT